MRSCAAGPRRGRKEKLKRGARARSATPFVRTEKFFRVLITYQQIAFWVATNSRDDTTAAAIIPQGSSFFLWHGNFKPTITLSPTTKLENGRDASRDLVCGCFSLAWRGGEIRPHQKCHIIVGGYFFLCMLNGHRTDPSAWSFR